MKKDTVLVAVCNQKGGVGKSTMTIMLAGYYHYLKGLNVAVIDCDYPQYSLVRMKERDMRTVENSDYFLKSATKSFIVLFTCTRSLITELLDKLRLKYPLLPTIPPYPTMRLETIRSIIPISCRRYPKSV